MSLFTKLGTEINAPVTSAGTPRGGDMLDEMVWKTEAERLFAAFTAGAGVVFVSKASADANLDYAQFTMAWVFDSDPALAGIYRKIGASGTGSWVWTGDLPYSFVRLFDVGAGTPNAIQLTSAIPTSASAMRVANVVDTNTGAVTISENGVTAKSLLTSSGNPIATGGIVAGMMIAYVDDGTSFRLLSDQASAAIQAAAEAAQVAAEAARDEALAAVPNAFPLTISTLKGLNSAVTTSAYLLAGGREGQFYFDPTDLSSKIIARSLTSFSIATASDTVSLALKTTTSVDSGTDTMTCAAHGFIDGDLLYTTTTVNGLTSGVRYFVINATTDTFQLSLEHGSSTAVNITGTTNFSVRKQHDLATGDAVIVGSSVNGLSTNTVYYVIVVDVRTFKFATSRANALAGTAIDLTNNLSLTTHVLTDPQEGIYVIPNGKSFTGSQGAWVRVHQSGRYNASWFGFTETTADAYRAQAAIDYAWWRGGGEVLAEEAVYETAGSIYVWQNVYLRGVGAGYNYLYSSTKFQVYGSVIKMTTGGNADGVVGAYRLRATDSTPDHPDDARHQGGLTGFTLWGNRSSDQSPLVRDSNTAGSGLVIRGVSNFEVDNVLCVRWAEDGLEMISHDYGSGSAISSNNMVWGRVQCLSNYGAGARIAGADQQFGTITCGYNGTYGVFSTAQNSSYHLLYVWNNFDRGLYHSTGGFFSATAFRAYDNRGAGAFFSGCVSCVLDAYIVMRNGWGGTAAAEERAGVRFGSGVTDFTLGDGFTGDDGTQGGPYQNYGIYNGDAANTINPGAVSGSGNIIALTFGLPLKEASNTFTPSLQFGGAAVGMTYAKRSGRYVVDGREVRFTIEIELSAKGSSTGVVNITGLPKAAVDTTMVIAFGQSGMATLSGPISLLIASAGTSGGLFQQGATGGAALTEANFTSTSRIFISGSYFT